MKKSKLLLTSLVLIIMIIACANFSDFIGTNEKEPSQSLTSSDEEEQTSPTTSPTETPPPTEKPNPYLQIQTMLLSEPPCGGNQELRKEAILTLNEFLKDDAVVWDENLIAYYASMMDKVASEMDEPVTSGVRIWSMYNHGFIVKTPSHVFAFDLINGYDGWDYQLPESILEQIQVLFISHRHGDHQEYEITRGIIDLGGEVVKPIEDKSVAFDIIYLAADEVVNVAGLHVKAYDGLHGNLANRIYMITTPEGITVMHTGDNQTSETLPFSVTLDILLINAWVNEDGILGPKVGLSNSIKKLNPKLTIPGHIHELGHAYDSSSIFSRLPFESPLAVAEMDLPGEVSIQFWGERCDYPLE